MSEARRLQETQDADYNEVMTELLQVRAKHLEENPDQRIPAEDLTAELKARYPKK